MPLAPTNTQLSLKASSFTAVLPRSSNSRRDSSFILSARKQRYHVGSTPPVCTMGVSFCKVLHPKCRRQCVCVCVSEHLDVGRQLLPSASVRVWPGEDRHANRFEETRKAYFHLPKGLSIRCLFPCLGLIKRRPITSLRGFNMICLLQPLHNPDVLLRHKTFWG